MSRRLGITSDRTVEMQGSSYKHVLQLWQKRLLHTPENTSTEGSQTLAPDKTFRYLMPLILALNRRGRIMHISILALVTGFGFFAYVSLFFGQTSVLLAPRKAPDLASCGDRACFRGLIPYETPWSEAIEQFNGHNQILDDAEYAQIVLLPTSDSTTLASILLDISFDQNLPLAAVLSLYGPPTCIEIYRLHGVVMLHYPSLHLMSQVGRTGVLGPDTLVLKVVLGGEPVNEGQVEICDGPLPQIINHQLSRHTWQGFKSISHYFLETA